MLPVTFLCWLTALSAISPGDDTFCVEPAGRPFCGPPQLVRHLGYVYVDGKTGNANVSKVRLIRRGVVTVVNLKKIRGHPEQDIKLEPGDSIQIPQGFF